MRADFGLTECALCGRSEPLQESHIIPRFVYEWLKKTSATGHARMSGNPNRRAQDGWKGRLLCFGCEQLFGQWEKTFKERVFAPIHEGGAVRVPYESWMLGFAVSVSWRVLKVHQLDGRLGDVPPAVQRAACSALRAWQDFLRGIRTNPGVFEQHVLVVDLIESATTMKLSPYINRYFMRSVDLDIPHSDKVAFTYAKMGRLVLMGHMTELGGWKGTKLHLAEGIIGADVYELPNGLLHYFQERAEVVSNAMRSLSSRQKNVVKETAQRDLDRFARSEMFRAMNQDVEMFGKAAFAPKETKGE